MANTKISGLPSATSLVDATVIPVVESGTTKKLTGSQLKTYAQGGLSTVASSGSYNDLTNKPSLATVATSGSYTDLTNKPTLATVATSGSYNDLTNKPSSYSLPTASTTTLGGVKVDGTTVTINGSGVISSTGGGGAVSAITAGSKNFTIDSTGNITSNIISQDSTASTVELYNSPTTLSVYHGTDNGTLNLGSGLTAAGKTITVNLGTNGLLGSTTLINIGSAVQGATNITLVSGSFRGVQMSETVNFVTPTPVSNVVSFDCLGGQIFEFTMTNITANFIMNLNNLNLGNGYTTTVTIILKQGSSAYYCTGLQIGGVSQTQGTNFFWQGGVTPTGTPNKRDIIAFSITNQGGNYTTYAQLVSWG